MRTKASPPASTYSDVINIGLPNRREGAGVLTESPFKADFEWAGNRKKRKIRKNIPQPLPIPFLVEREWEGEGYVYIYLLI